MKYNNFLINKRSMYYVFSMVILPEHSFDIYEPIMIPSITDIIISRFLSILITTNIFFILYNDCIMI